MMTLFPVGMFFMLHVLQVEGQSISVYTLPDVQRVACVNAQPGEDVYAKFPRNTKGVVRAASWTEPDCTGTRGLPSQRAARLRRMRGGSAGGGIGG